MTEPTRKSITPTAIRRMASNSIRKTRVWTSSVRAQLSPRTRSAARVCARQVSRGGPRGAPARAGCTGMGSEGTMQRVRVRLDALRLILVRAH